MLLLYLVHEINFVDREVCHHSVFLPRTHTHISCEHLCFGNRLSQRFCQPFAAWLFPQNQMHCSFHVFRFQVMFFVKRVHWDCSWDVSSDSDLLKGIYQHGMGAWEAVKMDTELELHDRVIFLFSLLSF